MRTILDTKQGGNYSTDGFGNKTWDTETYSLRYKILSDCFNDNDFNNEFIHNKRKKNYKKEWYTYVTSYYDYDVDLDYDGYEKDCY